MRIMKIKPFLLFGLLLIQIPFLSCTGRIARFEEGLHLSNEIYTDLYSQVESVYQTDSEDTERTQTLKLINEKFMEYRLGYDTVLKSLDTWRDSGQKPDDTMDKYKRMWEPLLEAQSIAVKLYIYPTECSSRTALKGKAGNNCP